MVAQNQTLLSKEGLCFLLGVHRHGTYLQVDKERTVGLDAFSRIAPAIPSIADVVSCSNLFNGLTASTGGRLSFANYEKYLSTLNRYLYHFICNSSQCHYLEKFITRMVVVFCLGKRMVLVMLYLDVYLLRIIVPLSFYALCLMNLQI